MLTKRMRQHVGAWAKKEARAPPQKKKNYKHAWPCP